MAMKSYEVSVIKLMKRIGQGADKRIMGWQLINAMHWQYKSDACSVVQEMGDQGLITRSWDEQGEVWYSLPVKAKPG